MQRGAGSIRIRSPAFVGRSVWVRPAPGCLPPPGAARVRPVPAGRGEFDPLRRDVQYEVLVRRETGRDRLRQVVDDAGRGNARLTAEDQGHDGFIDQNAVRFIDHREGMGPLQRFAVRFRLSREQSQELFAEFGRLPIPP